MEVIGLLLLVVIVNLVAGSLKKAGKGAGMPPSSRTPGHLPRRQFQDVLSQMMEQVGIEASVESEFVGEGAAPRELAPSYVPLSCLFEGDSRFDEPGCVGGTLAHDMHEGEEFPGHIHSYAAMASAFDSTPSPGQPSPGQPSREQAPMSARARLTGGQARYAVVVSEVLGRPVSMRKGGVRH